MTDQKPKLEVVTEVEVVEAEVATPPTPVELGLELSGDPSEAQAQLLLAIQEARTEAAENRDGMLRAMAELENNRKRAISERSLMLSQASERIINRVLPVLDSFAAALGTKSDTDDTSLVEGMRNTFAQLKDAMTAEGVTEIPAVGEPFDPEVHEAVSTLGEGDSLVVLHELRKGYRLRQRVIRPATVVVGPPEAQTPPESE
jgi:molecular chaperone GrpE